MHSARIHFWGILIAFLFFSQPVDAQQNSLSGLSSPSPGDAYASKDQSVSEYNPSVPGLGLQFGSGVLFGAGGGIITGFAAAALFAPEGQYTAWPYLLNGFYTGYSTISALGVYIAANSNCYNASFKYILLGHGIGAIAGIGVMAISDSLDGNMGPAYLFTLVAPVIGGMIANKMSIKRQSGSRSALLNIPGNSDLLSIPSIRLTRPGNHNLVNKKVVPTVSLLSIQL